MRGGKRENAGRKPVDGEVRVTLNARVRPETLRLIREGRGERSIGQYIDSIVAQADNVRSL